MTIPPLGLLALLLSPLPCYALDLPKPSPLDSNIQHSHYDADDVVSITAYPGMATHLVLSPSEKIEEVYSGFSDGWEFETTANHLFLKAKSVTGTKTEYDLQGKAVEREVQVQPQASKWKTNLIIVTNKRNYSFALNLGKGRKGLKQTTYRLTFDYPAEQAKHMAAVSSQQSLDDALQQAPQPKNWDYTMQVGEHSRTIAPSKVFDDEVFTYITFALNSEIPAVFIVDDLGGESLINSHINPSHPNTLIVQRVAHQFALRLDKAVVGITNQAFSHQAPDTRLSPVEGVSRITKESP